MRRSTSSALGGLTQVFLGLAVVWVPAVQKVNARGPIQIKRVAGLLLVALILYPLRTRGRALVLLARNKTVVCRNVRRACQRLAQRQMGCDRWLVRTRMNFARD